MACCVVGENQTVMTYVEAQVRNRRKLRDLAAEIGICKSSLSRHMRDCVQRREAVKHSPRAQKINLISCRVITAWPIEGGFKLTVQTEYGSYGQAVENYGSTSEVVEIHANELRSTDVLCVVRYDSAREARNPKALSPEEPVVEEVSELSVAADDKLSDATPCEDSKTVDNVHTKNLVAAAPEPTPCQHVMVPISSGISRCQLCAFQENAFQVTGVSRKWHEERQRDIFSKRPRFGRFG
jgi:hypothetical protein